MKTFLNRQILSIAAFGLAAAGAFTTHAMERSAKPTSLIVSHKKANPAGVCDISSSFMCETVNTGPLCRTSDAPGAPQVYGLNSSTNTCVIEVWKPQ